MVRVMILCRDELRHNNGLTDTDVCGVIRKKCAVEPIGLNEEFSESSLAFVQYLCTSLSVPPS
jgi:hypothetical protein